MHDQYAVLADRLLTDLRVELDIALGQVSDTLAERHRDLLHREHHRWASSSTWQLINAADPCGT